MYNKNQGHSGCPSLRVSYLPALLLVPLKLGGGGLQYQQLPLNLPWLVHGMQLGQLGVQGHKAMDIGGSIGQVGPFPRWVHFQVGPRFIQSTNNCSVS